MNEQDRKKLAASQDAARALLKIATAGGDVVNAWDACDVAQDVPRDRIRTEIEGLRAALDAFEALFVADEGVIL